VPNSNYEFIKPNPDKPEPTRLSDQRQGLSAEDLDHRSGQFLILPLPSWEGWGEGETMVTVAFNHYTLIPLALWERVGVRAKKHSLWPPKV